MSRTTNYFNTNRGNMWSPYRMNRSYSNGFPSRGFLKNQNHPMNPVLFYDESYFPNPAAEQAGYLAQREAGFRNGGGQWRTKLAIQDKFASLMQENNRIGDALQNPQLSSLDRNHLVDLQRRKITEIHQHQMINEMMDERNSHKQQMRHLTRAHKRQMRQQRFQRMYSMMGGMSPYGMAGGMSPYNPFAMNAGAFGAPPPYSPYGMGSFGAPPPYSPYGMGMGATPFGYNMAANMYDPVAPFNQPYHHIAPPPYDAPPVYADARENIPHHGETTLHLPSLGSYYIPTDVQNSLNMLTNEYNNAGSDVLKRFDARQKLAYYLQANFHHFMPTRNYRTGRMLSGTPEELQKIMQDLTLYTPNEGVRLTEDKLSMLGILRNRDEIEGIQKYVTRPAIERYKKSIIQLANLLPANERRGYRQISSICARLRALHENRANANPPDAHSVNVMNSMKDVLIHSLMGGVFPGDEAPERGVFPEQFKVLEQVLENHGHGQSISGYLDLLSDTIPADATRKLYDIKAKINDEQAYIFNRAMVQGGCIDEVVIRDFVSYPSFLTDLLGDKHKSKLSKRITFNGFNMSNGNHSGFLTIANVDGSNPRIYDIAKIKSIEQETGDVGLSSAIQYGLNGMYDNIQEQTEKHRKDGKSTVRVAGNGKTHFRLGALVQSEGRFAAARVADVKSPLLTQQNRAAFGLEGMGSGHPQVV